MNETNCEEPNSHFELFSRISCWFKQSFFFLSLCFLSFSLCLRVEDLALNYSEMGFVVLILFVIWKDSSIGNSLWSGTSYLWAPVYVLYVVFLAIRCFSVDESRVDAFSSEEETFAWMSLLFSVLGCISFLVSTREVPKRQVNSPPVEYTTGFLSYVTFSFINDLLNLGETKESLQAEDVPFFADQDTCESIYSLMDYASLARDPSLLGRRLVCGVWFQVITQNACAFVSCIFSLAAPLSLQSILIYIAHMELSDADDDEVLVTWLNPITAVLLLCGGVGLKTITDGQNFMIGRRIAMRSRCALISVLYRKSLYADLSTIAEGTGTLNNLISVDAKEVSEWMCYFPFMWSCLTEISLSLGLLCYLLGVSALGGVMAMFLMVPMSAFSSKYLDGFQKKLLTMKDERMGVINEMLSGIRIIKVSGDFILCFF